MLFRDKDSSLALRFLPMAFFFVFAMVFYCVDVSATQSIEEACKKKFPQEQIKQQENCIQTERKKQSDLMVKTINCSIKLANKYEMEEDTLEKSSSKDEDEYEEEEMDNHVILVKLQKDCSKEKQSATECCSNPNSCNGFALDLAQHVLPLAPALYGAYKSYKISDEANDKMSQEGLSAEEAKKIDQEIRDKMCNAKNTATMGAFATGLLSQLAPMFQKSCGKRIAKCKKACNSKVDQFKQDFRNCYKDILPNKNISQMRQFVQKYCFNINANLKDQSFELEPNNNVHFTYPEKNYCFFSIHGKGFERSNSQELNPSKVDSSALAWLLYIAKAYQNTSIKEKKLSDNSDEEEIIDCGDQPNRMLANSSKPGGPLPPPAIEICRRALEQAVNPQGNPPPKLPVNSARNPNAVQQAGLLAGNTTGGDAGRLQIPPGEEECEYGVVDSAKLEECRALGSNTDEDFETKNRPSLAKNLPTWKNGGSGGSSGAGGGGGGIPGGAGALGGNDDSKGRSTPYGPYNGNMNTGANFGGDGFSGPYPGSEGGSRGGGERDIAESDDDPMLDQEMPLEEPYGDDEKTIFQIASERIQVFCVDNSCDN